MRKIAVVMLLGILATGTAFASPITVDGNLSDWGVTANSSNYTVDNNNWTPTPGITWWSEDNTNVGGLGNGSVGPGYGGQNFDVEAAYLTSQNGVVYGAFVSGFDRAGQYGWDKSVRYATGDLFFAINPTSVTPTWSFAICMYSHDGFVMGQAYIPKSPSSTWYTTPSDYGSSAPSQLSGPVSNFTVLAGVQYAYSDGTPLNDNALAGDPYQAADHNIVEVSLIGLDLRAAFPGTPADVPLEMHYTESCGNDLFNLSANVVLMPEPCTASLLAIGVVGVFARWRRKGGRSCPTA